MALNLRKKRFLDRLAGYGTNPARRKIRVALGREQTHQIWVHDVALPPSHDLPFDQRRDPTYDSYAIPVLAHLAASTSRMMAVDLGVNVGDSAVAALSATDNIDVIAVEGDDTFLYCPGPRSCWPSRSSRSPRRGRALRPSPCSC